MLRDSLRMIARSSFSAQPFSSFAYANCSGHILPKNPPVSSHARRTGKSMKRLASRFVKTPTMIIGRKQREYHMEEHKRQQVSCSLISHIIQHSTLSSFAKGKQARVAIPSVWLQSAVIKKTEGKSRYTHAQCSNQCSQAQHCETWAGK